jgi:hypothetical protein
MPKHLNAASRLYSIFEATHNSSKDTDTVIVVWSRFFKIEELRHPKLVAAVSDRLVKMQFEIELVEKQMQTLGFSESLYQVAIQNAEASISPWLISSQWNSVKQYLTPQFFTALGFCAELLPDEEKLISEEEISEICKSVDELEEVLLSTSLPERLRALIAHHVSLIRKAVEEYPIRGAISLREAGRTALGELIEIKDEVAEHKTAPEIDKLGDTWKRVNNAADAALKMEKIAQLGTKAWTAIQNIFG